MISAFLQQVLSFIAIPLLIITCLSCSVKEDRTICPCILTIHYSGTETIDSEENISTRIDIAEIQGTKETIVDTLPVYESTHRIDVSRGSATILSAAPISAISQTAYVPEDRWIEIREGHPCPRIWTSCVKVNTDSDSAEAEAVLHKNYCCLNIMLTGSGTSDFILKIRGNISGYDLNGNPAKGKFVAPAEENINELSGQVYNTVCVPRQVDNSLKLDIISNDDTAITFAIGNYIEASGYDWTSPDLKDINMEIDYSRTSITFHINKWQETVHFELVI